jgi:hypothetical protein
LITHNSTRYHCTRSSTEEFEDTKGAIRIRISKNNRQHNGQKKKGQKDKQRSTKYRHQIKDCVTRTPLKTGNELLHLPLSHLPSLIQKWRNSKPKSTPKPRSTPIIVVLLEFIDITDKGLLY